MDIYKYRNSMNYFKNFVQGNDNAQPTGGETVTRLCDRVASSTLLEDRRDAVRALKSLSRKFRYQVGSQGLQHVLNIIEVDVNDAEIIAYSLDTLFNLVTLDMEDEEDMNTQPEVVEDFACQLVADSKVVTKMLDLIDNYDFNVRWACVKLLTSLLRSKRNVVQGFVLENPMGMSRLIDLLSDSREIIRNDAILALIEITKGNTNIQKIVAFESGFEMLLKIIIDEGCSDGGVVVEDCLTLLLNLLHHNTSNQQFFKESSLIQRLTVFFEIGEDALWSAQKVANLHLMLKVVRTLVSPSNPSNVTASCQANMRRCGLLGKLSGMLMATGVPADILTETINSVAEVIRGCPENQTSFDSVMAPCEPPRPAIVILLMSMINDKQPFELRCAVLYCFQSYLHGNHIGQSKIVQTLLPSSIENQEVSAGQLLCAGLFSVADPLSNWCSAVGLSHALHGNNEMQQQLLRVQLATSPGNPPISLMQQITIIARQSSNLQARMGLLILLCSWLSGCPLAVTQFLNDPSAVSFLLSQVAEHGNEMELLLHGVGALLLGICIINNDGSVPESSKESIIELIVARVGVEKFCDALSCVVKHDLYSKSFQKPQPIAAVNENMIFDHMFTKLYKNLEDTVIKMVSNLDGVKKEEEAKAAIKAHDAIVNEYKTLIRDQDIKLAELRTKVTELQKELDSTKDNLEEKTGQVQQLKDQYNLLKISQPSTSDNNVANGDEKQQIESLKTEILSLKNTITERDLLVSKKETTIDQLSSDLQALEESSIKLSSSDERQSNSQIPTNIPDDSLANAQNSTNIPDDSRLQEQRLNQLADEMDSLKLELSMKQEQITKLDNENSAIKTDTDSLKSELLIVKQENTKLKEDLQNISTQMKDAKSECVNVKKEQEDLLILLSEQESKLSSYKTKLKELDQEVSEDEEGLSDEESDIEDD